jgi:hypothetical protein
VNRTRFQPTVTPDDDALKERRRHPPRDQLHLAQARHGQRPEAALAHQLVAGQVDVALKAPGPPKRRAAGRP